MKEHQLKLSIEESLSRQKPGWLFPYLAQADVVELDVPRDVAAPGKPKGVAYHYEGHGRWYWWTEACWEGRIPETPIPQIHWQSQPDPVDAKAIQDVLKPYLWKGRGGYDDAWMDLVRWLLNGFGYQYEGRERDLERIPADIRALWYETFNLFTLLHSPCDWSAFVLQHGLQDDGRTQSAYTGSGFFSTPMSLCQMMTEMTFGGEPDHEHKFLSVLEPCCGTGSLLLTSSNYSLRLFGQELVYDLVLCAILNSYLWMPWMVLMPDHMREVLENGTHKPVGVEYVTDPETVAKVLALREGARKGELVQLAML